MKYNKWISLAIILCLTTMTFAQDKDFTKSGDSDPKAKVLLDKLKKKYTAYESLEAKFTLTIQSEDGNEVQKGTVTQKGDKFKLVTATRDMYCDGTTLWVHSKEDNRIEINDYEPDPESDMGFLAPQDLLKMYESGDYVYILGGNSKLKGKLVNVVEFKPLDADSEFFKMKLFVDKENNKPMQFTVYSKDGFQYILSLDKLIPNKVLPDSFFKMDTKKFPKCTVEDLRF